MRRSLPIITGSICLTAAFAVVQFARIGRQTDGSFLLPTGQYITPAGRHLEVNDRPLGLTLSPDGATAAVVTGSNFAPRALHLFSLASSRITQTLPLKDSFAGVAFSPDGNTLYIGGGQAHKIFFFRKQPSGLFAPDGDLPIAESAPSGLAVTPDGRTLLAALNQKHSVAIVDLPSRSLRLVPVSNYPYTIAVSPDASKAYVSNWGGRKPRPEDKTDGIWPLVLDPRTGIPSSGTISVIDISAARVTREIEVGLHPSGLALHAPSHRLYITNANSDSVSVIDTTTDRLLHSIPVQPTGNAPLGSSPNAITVSKNGKTLFVANAANNAVAIVDLAPKPAIRGFVPTGWYPTAVALSPNETTLLVASGYGFGSNAPTADGKSGRSYKDRKGVVSLVPIPATPQLATFTRQVLANNRTGAGFRNAPASASHPVPMDRSQISPIKHVFYIIKENRTYDQLFGDLKQGNGDPALVQFGRDVTPNHHALAEQFVLFDNFFAPGDQSALGHRWCTQGYASDWVHKYGNGRNDTNPMLYAPTGFLWDSAKAAGIPVRSYGERGLVTFTPPNPSWSDVYSDWKNKSGKIQIAARTPIVGLRDIYSPHYPGFQMAIPDQLRVDIFLKDFAEFEKNGNLPQLTILLLPTDHTNGTAPGYPTPRAMVADNDLALGRLVQAISNSRYWSQSAIFVVEDDAQNGTDHVDGHRTIAFIISPFTQRAAVDSTFYTTINMYRTIEQILGLTPSNQFDLAAEPMFTAFTASPNNKPYTALPNRIPLDEMNPPLRALRGLARELSLDSMKMDFDEPDAAPEDDLNRAIWHSVKGYDRPYPSPKPTR